MITSRRASVWVLLALRLPAPLGQPHGPAGARIVVPAPFLIGLKDKRRYGHGFTLSVDGNKGEISRGSVAHLAGLQVLGLHAHADLHGSPADRVQTCLEEKEVADEDGVMKVHAVDGRSDNVHTGMARCDHSGRLVDDLHDHTAVDVPCGVRVLGDHHLRHDDAAVRYAFAFHASSFRLENHS